LIGKTGPVSGDHRGYEFREGYLSRSSLDARREFA